MNKYVEISNIVFKCFDSFSQKSEEIGKFKIDEWAQIQTADGNNAITNLLVWTASLAEYAWSCFPIFNNFVFLHISF